jgi:hypothetical protein
MFSRTDTRLKDMLAVMTSPPTHSRKHVEKDNTLTCTDDLSRSRNAHEYSRHNTLKPTWQDFFGLEFLYLRFYRRHNCRP